MRLTLLLAASSLLFAGCAPSIDWDCQLAGDAPDAATQLGCVDDFALLASEPVDTSIPGARSVKTIVDQVNENSLTFQDSVSYPTHYDYASTFLGESPLPFVGSLGEFNATEYSSPTRRFLLGAVTHYEGPDVYVYEIAPYDTATAAMLVTALEAIQANAWFGEDLLFHPTSSAITAVAAELPASIGIITTDELYEGIDYQPLNVAESYGLLRFITAEELEDDAATFRDIVVLDNVPNDISVVMGIITAEFQTPLSHVNVLSANRGTPNMALRGAYEDPELRALEGEWVRLEVGSSDWTITQVTREEADEWWDANRPDEVQVPGADLSITALTDIELVVDLDAEEMREAIKTGTRAFGGKAAHFSVLARIPEVPSPPAFGVPIAHYFQFMQDNGFEAQVQAMLEDPEFLDDPLVRKTSLEQLRADMEAAPFDADLQAALLAKITSEFDYTRMRFRSSTNAEDLDGFTGAGLYTSKSGDPNDPDKPVMDAVREVWASVWNFRAFEERSYRSIDHLAVGMALLVHRSFPDEEANGVALTNNPYDLSGQESPFYVNVQLGGESVVQPESGITTEQLLYYYDRAGQPIVYLAESSLTEPGERVMTAAQLYELGESLGAIRSTFATAYATDGWWAMDVEFKLEGEPGEEPLLYVKQARPYGGG
jgi:pyruvate, water dikinase